MKIKADYRMKRYEQKTERGGDFILYHTKAATGCFAGPQGMEQFS